MGVGLGPNRPAACVAGRGRCRTSPTAAQAQTGCRLWPKTLASTVRRHVRCWRCSYRAPGAAPRQKLTHYVISRTPTTAVLKVYWILHPSQTFLISTGHSAGHFCDTPGNVRARVSAPGVCGAMLCRVGRRVTFRKRHNRVGLARGFLASKNPDGAAATLRIQCGAHEMFGGY
jgi:hypothetical protein